jgi:adenosyl cobinamide kinase/adenosyl cobinamide phosphate guanylyltransferase
VSFLLLTGGARSGKSSAAVRAAQRLSAPVAIVATAIAGDADMERRIAAHRAERPDGWTTIEEPVDLLGAFDQIDDDATTILDCMTFWAFNRIELGEDDRAVLDATRQIVGRIGSRSGATIAVTNQVGSGVVPATTSGVHYRDLLGSINRTLADGADRTLFMVAGRAIELRPMEELL